MTLRHLLFASLLVFAAAAAAQNMQVRPIQLQANPAATAIDETGMLRTEVAKLRSENKRLAAENADLRAQVDGYRVLGGSQVHAYCSAPATSRNTAGAESDCAKSGYNCESVSGLCRTSCQTSDMCAGGFTCDTSTSQCVYTGG